MRGFLLTLFILATPVTQAGAQTALPNLPAHQAAAAPAAPAKPAPTIIPGSPLAALTSPSPPAAQEPAAPDPFGTDNLGLSIIDRAAGEAQSTINEFTGAIRRSTELTPVIQWLRSFGANQGRRHAFADATMGLVLAILPAILAEAIMRFALLRPRAKLAAYALARRKIDFPDPPENESLDAAEIGDIEPRNRRVSAIAWLRRLSLALIWIFLALVPILAFAATVGALLATSIIATHATRLIITGAGNAYLFWRFASEILRFLFAPRSPELRLIHTSDKRAAWIVQSLAIFTITIAAGIFLITSAEILGLSRAGATVLSLLVALAAHIEIAVMIWQSRHIVARWIRGKPNEAKLAFGIRPRLAGIWHFIALFYVLALWIAYAGGIHNAFGVLLRVVIVFVFALIAARLAWFGFSSLLDRVLDDQDDETRAHPTLRARVRAYDGLVKLTLRIVIFGCVLVFMLQGWGFNIIPWLLSDPLSRSLLHAAIAILITIAVSLTLWELSNALINSRIDRLAAAGKARQASRLRTLLPMLKASIGVALFLTAALISLSQIGVNLVPLLAVSGVAGIAIGFGSQKLVQDIITGLFLLLEDAMQVGDTVTLAGMTGNVERLSIRTIRLRGGDGSINIIPFSAVTTVTNMTRDFGYAQISITVSYKEDLDHVTAVLMDIAKKMRAEPQWGAQMRDDLQLFGLDSFGDYGLVIIGQIRTGPGQHWPVRREFYARVQKRFAEDGIQIPYNHQSLSLDAGAFRGVQDVESKQGQGAPPPGPPPRAEPLEPGPVRE
jgi:small conductance mechanosensitive channel